MKMNKEQVLGIIRHILTFAGGYIIAWSSAHGSPLTELDWTNATAAIVTLVGLVWSFVAPEKKAPSG